MYAIVEVGGRQWKVEPGTRLEINRVPTAVGATHTVDRVLLAHDGTQLQFGRPYVEGAKVTCEVVAHRQGPKAISYHFRRRENFRNTQGHRQPLTQLLVKDIVWAGQAASKAQGVMSEAPSAPKKKPAAKATVQAATTKRASKPSTGATHGT